LNQNEDVFLHTKRNASYDTYINDSNKAIISIKLLAGRTIQNDTLRGEHHLVPTDRAALAALQKTTVDDVTQVQLDANQVDLIGSPGTSQMALNAKWDLFTLSSYLADDFRAVSVDGIPLSDTSAFMSGQYCNYVAYYDGWTDRFTDDARNDLGRTMPVSPTPVPIPTPTSRISAPSRPVPELSVAPSVTPTPPACE
jgi:hypothetical protein